MNSTGAFEKALNLLDSEDDFELIKAVRFLSAFGDKSAIPHLLEVLETSPAAENIAGEIPFLSSIQNMLKTHDKNSVLNCFDLILTGLGEIYPLNDLFFFEVYNVLQYLIEQQKHNAPDSHIAAILLRAYEKFSSIHDCDEYLFDESKDVKNEIKDIFDLLNSQQKEFWTQQKEIIPNELKQSKFRSISALDIIRLMEITSAKNDVINFINSVRDEQSILAGLGAAKSLDILNKLDKEELKSKIANPTLSEVLESFFV